MFVRLWDPDKATLVHQEERTVGFRENGKAKKDLKKDLNLVRKLSEKGKRFHVRTNGGRFPGREATDLGCDEALLTALCPGSRSIGRSRPHRRI